MPAALVTGSAQGIGKALAVALAQRGYSVTVVDIALEDASAVATSIRQTGQRAIAVAADVANAGQLARAFGQHVQEFGTLECAVLNAGISERGSFLDAEDEGWRQTLAVNLVAVADGVRCAARIMARQRQGGTIMVTASAGALFPMPLAPIYAASKAGAVGLVKSLAQPLQKKGIRICALCPQFVDTMLVRGVEPTIAQEVMRDTQGKLLSVDQVAAAGMHLLEHDRQPGRCLVILACGQWVEPLQTRFRRLDPTLAAWASSDIPASAEVIQVCRLSPSFREATTLARIPLAMPPRAGHVLVRVAFAGVNASDVNFTDGRYFASRLDAAASLPYAAGFEAVGAVAAVANDVDGICVGQSVAVLLYGAFADYVTVPARRVIALPCPPVPETVALLTSGLTASIGLEEAGRLRSCDKVLVTAAAGGTGQFAVQLSKLKGCRVVAVCGSQDKARLLQTLGADRTINYREESLKAVLKAEYSEGMNVIYESVGGSTFATCLDALAPRGRLVVIGMMSAYQQQGGWQASTYVGLPEKLLQKSATISGFFLLQHAGSFRQHLAKLLHLWQTGRLRVVLEQRRFVGLASVADAVDWLQSGRSAGKVFVQVPDTLPPLGGPANLAAKL